VESESARFQGSEYPRVVIPLITGAWMMLQRNLPYTAVTRAKRLVVLVGSPRALGQAVRATGTPPWPTASAAVPAAPAPRCGGRRDGTRLTPGSADSERPTRRTRHLSCGSSEEGAERLPKPARCVGTRS
jgi:hypothetical protein